MPVPPVIQMYRYVMGSGGGVSNLLLGSEELGSTGVGRWNQNLMNAVNSDQVNNPEGTEQTADQLDFQASKTARITQDVTLVAGTEYTFSVWARAASGTQDFRLSYWDNVGRNFGTSAHTASATWSPTTGRYSFTFTAATSGTFSMYIQNATDAVSRRIYFWGAMLNVGATAADYIKTEFIGPSSPATPLMEFGDNFAGVTAYYSLRRFTRGADNNAIRVRRSSDDTEQDIGFDANGDLDTTALTTFVNADVNQYTSDFSSTEDLSETNGTGAAAQSVGGVDDAYKFTLSGGSGLHQSLRGAGLSGGGTATLSLDYYIPSSNTAVDGLLVGVISGTTQSESTTDAWTSVSLSVTNFGNGNVFFRATDGGSTTIDADGDVFYLKNIVVTQTTADGAVTTFYDQSGNGNDATNATESEQPLVVSGGTLVEENSKAALDFDGVDDSFTANALAGLSRLDLFFATQTTDTTYVHFNAIGALTERGFIAQESSTLSGSVRDMGAPTMYNNGIEFTGTTRDDVHTAQDGHQVISYIDADTTAFSTFEIGGHSGYVFGGKFQELIAFNSDQSANRTGIESNINDHFDIYP